MSDHSATIQASTSHAHGDETLRANYVASCLCGWREEHVYHRRERAARAFQRHLAEAKG